MQKFVNNEHLRYCEAVDVVEKLKKNGFNAYIQEGGVTLCVENEDELEKANTLVNPIEFVKGYNCYPGPQPVPG